MREADIVPSDVMQYETYNAFCEIFSLPPKKVETQYNQAFKPFSCGSGTILSSVALRNPLAQSIVCNKLTSSHLE